MLLLAASSWELGERCSLLGCLACDRLALDRRDFVDLPDLLAAAADFEPFEPDLDAAAAALLGSPLAAFSSLHDEVSCCWSSLLT